MPFSGPIGAARVGYKDGQYLLNPGASQLEESDLNLVVAGTENAVLMVESEANCLSEEVMLGSVVFGHEQMQTAIHAIKEFSAEVNNTPWGPPNHIRKHDWKKALQDLADTFKSTFIDIK